MNGMANSSRIGLFGTWTRTSTPIDNLGEGEPKKFEFFYNRYRKVKAHGDKQ